MVFVLSFSYVAISRAYCGRFVGLHQNPNQKLAVNGCAFKSTIHIMSIHSIIHCFPVFFRRKAKIFRSVHRSYEFIHVSSSTSLTLPSAVFQTDHIGCYSWNFAFTLPSTQSSLSTDSSLPPPAPWSMDTFASV